MIKEQVKWFGEDKKKMKMQVEKKKRNGNTGHKIKKDKKKSIAIREQWFSSLWKCFYVKPVSVHCPFSYYFL